MELDCFAWAGTTDRAVFTDDVAMERTEPGEQKYSSKYRQPRHKADI